ncbi:UNVERIFIED_ORG: hypothetical protein B5F06_09805 [Lacrimispora saccharolytica]|nr:hypothetical protein CLS_31980 [[Clostridium] cf. saccharolyticum K10]
MHRMGAPCTVQMIWKADSAACPSLLTKRATRSFGNPYVPFAAARLFFPGLTLSRRFDLPECFSGSPA